MTDKRAVLCCIVVVEANARLRASFDTTKPVGQPFQELLSPEWRDDFRKTLLAVQVEEARQTLRSALLPPSGSVIKVEASLSLVALRTAESRGILCIMTREAAADTTQSSDVSSPPATAEDVLRRSNEQFRSLQSQLPVGVYRTSGDGKVLEVNSSFAHIFGYESPSDILGRNARSLYLDPTRRDDLVEALTRDGEVRDFEMEALKADGTSFWLRVSASATIDADGHVQYIQGAVENIADRKATEERLHISERKYLHLIENLLEGIWIINADFVTTFVNPRMAQMLGCAESEIVGRRIFSFLDRPGMRSVRKSLSHAESETRETIDIELLRPDGSKIHALAQATPIVGASGARVGAIAGVIDISERRRVEEALRIREDLYRAVVETMTEGLAMRDLEGRFTYVNDRFCEMIGYSRERLLASNSLEFLDELNAGILKRQMTRPKGSQREPYELSWTRSDGRGLATIISPAVLRGPDGEVIGAFAIMTDITERKRIEDRLREAGRTLEARHRDLIEKNIAMKQIFKHLDQEKAEYRRTICNDIDLELTRFLDELKRTAEHTSRDDRVDSLAQRMRLFLTRDVGDFPGRYNRLTMREREVCDLIRAGIASKEISNRLNLSLLTVHKHREHIRRKLRLNNKSVSLATYLDMHRE